ncbi:MAG: hypothetical protein Q9207_007921 [Kuettlingeria erythrocarpa]
MTANYTIDDRLLQEMRKDEDRKAQAKGYLSHAERIKKRQDRDDERSRQREQAFIDRSRSTMDRDIFAQCYAEAERLVQEMKDKRDRQAQAAGYASHSEEMKARDDQVDERIRQKDERIRHEDERLRQDPALLEAKREWFITAASVAEPVSSQFSSEPSCNCDEHIALTFCPEKLINYRSLPDEDIACVYEHQHRLPLEGFCLSAKGDASEATNLGKPRQFYTENGQ